MILKRILYNGKEIYCKGERGEKMVWRYKDGTIEHRNLPCLRFSDGAYVHVYDDDGNRVPY